jgi:hypothetical protein
MLGDLKEHQISQQFQRKHLWAIAFLGLALTFPTTGEANGIIIFLVSCITVDSASQRTAYFNLTRIKKELFFSGPGALAK